MDKVNKMLSVITVLGICLGCNTQVLKNLKSLVESKKNNFLQRFKNLNELFIYCIFAKKK